MAAPLKHRTLTGALLDRLRDAILSGEYPAGAQLRQDALAEAYGVSRIPVREALLQLDAEGLVKVQPRRGAVVSELSLEEVEDVFDLRAMLEPRLLRASAPRLGLEDWARIQEADAAYAAAAAAGEGARFGELNAALHMALYAAAGQPRTRAVVEGLLKTSERYIRMQLARPEALARSTAEHGALMAACRAGRVEAAAEMLIAHIEQVRRDLRAVLAGAGRRGPGAG